MRKGRYWVGLWLVFVLGTMATVVQRQTSALGVAGNNDSLKVVRIGLEAERAVQLARIRAALGRTSIGPRAEGIGLRFPVDSEIIFLDLPTGPR